MADHVLVTPVYGHGIYGQVGVPHPSAAKHSVLIQVLRGFIVYQCMLNTEAGHSCAAFGRSIFHLHLFPENYVGGTLRQFVGILDGEYTKTGPLTRVNPLR